jgi:hypothetical protein
VNWRLWSWRDVIAFTVVIVGLAALFLYVIPVFPMPKNFGFGPEWDCRPVPNGEPICTKKPAPR